MTTNGAPTGGTSPRPAARGDRPGRELWQVPTFLAGLLAVSLVSANVSVRTASPAPVGRDLAAARALLRDRHGSADQALALARAALAAAGEDPEPAAEAHLLLGL